MIAHPAEVFGETPNGKALLPQPWYKRLFGRKALSPDGLQVVQFPVSWPTLEGWAGSYSALYRTQPSVRTVVDFLAKAVADTGLKVYRRKSDTDRPELHDHPLAVLLRNPNPFTTANEMMVGTVSDIAIYGNAYWLKVRAGRQIQTVRIPPSQIFLDGENVLVPRQYRLQSGDIVPADQIVHFHYYHPDDPRVGLSPLETLRQLLLEEIAASSHRRGFWRNAARNSAVIERPLDSPDWSDESRKRFREDWERLQSGSDNAGKTAVLEEGMKYHSVSVSPAEAQFLESRRLTNEEVARAFNVPLPVVGLTGGANFASTSEYHKMLYQDTLPPWYKMLEGRIDLQLLPEFSDIDKVYVEFNIQEKLRGSFEEQSDVLTRAVGRPWMTVGEARGVMNMADRQDPTDDDLTVPLNIILGGQPAVNEPLQDGGDRESLRAAAARHYQLALQKFFERQRRVILTDAGIAKRMGEKNLHWDKERWDRELATDLAIVSMSLGQDADLSDQNSHIASEHINREIRLAVAEAGVDSDALQAVFESAINERAAEFADGTLH